MTPISVPGKWIGGIHADTPLAEAARRALRVRLKAVEAMLPLAAKSAEEDDEHVHRLRVATRRAATALRIFRGCCEKASSFPRMRRGLRRLRRAAAAARECDVHRAMLTADLAGAGDALHRILDSVLALVADERRRAQKSIRREARRYPVRRLRKLRRRLLAAIEAPGDPAGERLADAARATMASCLSSMRAAAENDLSSMEDLHGLRIEGKRLRYAMEIFQPCFEETFAESYAAVEALQEELGAINDSHDLARRMEEFAELAARGELDAAPDEGALSRAVELYRDRRRRRIESFTAAWKPGGKASFFGAMDRLTSGLERGAEAPVLDVLTFPSALTTRTSRPEVLP